MQFPAEKKSHLCENGLQRCREKAKVKMTGNSSRLKAKKTHRARENEREWERERENSLWEFIFSPEQSTYLISTASSKIRTRFTDFVFNIIDCYASTVGRQNCLILFISIHVKEKILMILELNLFDNRYVFDLITGKLTLSSLFWICFVFVEAWFI